MKDQPSDNGRPRFGKVAVDLGYVTRDQLAAALVEQLDDNLADRPHRALGAILYDRGWIDMRQLEDVLGVMMGSAGA